ncbi:MAG: NAD(P)H-hydrate dehydratase [Nitrososphaerota archaeon]
MFFELTPELFIDKIPRRRSGSRKGENGRVLVLGGNWLYHGAPFHSARGAQASGVDLVYLAVPKQISSALRSMSADFIVYPLPDTKLTLGAVNRLLKWLPEIDSAVIGPGTVKPPQKSMQRLLLELKSRGIAVVLDAGALEKENVQLLTDSKAVITPHAGEFKRITDIELPADDADRARIVAESARKLGVVILQKGKGDVISDGKTTFFNRTGRAAMTVGGTGDVLAGLTAGLLALGVEPLYAAAVAAYANGLAGTSAWEKFGNRITASDLHLELRYALKQFERPDID